VGSELLANFVDVAMVLLDMADVLSPASVAAGLVESVKGCSLGLPETLPETETQDRHGQANVQFCL